MLYVTMVTPIQEKVFYKLTKINPTRGGKPTWSAKVFWFLYENGPATFSEIKREFGMKRAQHIILSRALKQLRKENIITKIDDKYALSPNYSNSINPLLYFEYISNKQPSLIFHNYIDETSNVHLLYGFNNPSVFIDLILAEINDGVDCLRELKTCKKGGEEKCVPRNVILFAIMHLWNEAFLRDYTIEAQKFYLFMRKLGEEAVEIAKELDLDISWNMQKFLHELEVVFGETSKYRIFNRGRVKSDEIALLSVPFLMKFYPAVNIKALIKHAKEISFNDFSKDYPYFKEFFEKRYGELVRIFNLNPFLNKIWRYGLILHVVTKWISKEHLDLAEYEIYEVLKNDFQKKEIDLLWSLIKEFKENREVSGDTYIIPVWIKIVCYRGINKIWEDKKDKLFLKYYEKLKALNEPEIYEEIKKMENKDKALLVAEYVLGEKIYNQYNSLSGLTLFDDFF